LKTFSLYKSHKQNLYKHYYYY